MADFIPRLNDNGIRGNRYWYRDNPFYQAGYGLPNCTCYAWGRWWESAGAEYRPNLSLSNAEDWWGYTADGYERGQHIALGACVCYADGDYSGYGHVAIVEQIFDDYAVVSNSAYDAYFWQLDYIGLNGQFPRGNYRFQGFIYNPHSGGEPVGSKKKIWLFKRKLWLHEKEDL